MTFYNPPRYIQGADAISLAPHPDQSVADLDGPQTEFASAHEYYAPSSWCEVFVESLSGAALFKLKANYLTPDGLYRWRNGETMKIEPHPDQLLPVDLDDFRVIQPHAKISPQPTGNPANKNYGAGNERPLWYAVKELNSTNGGMTVPSAWLDDATSWQDNLSGADIRDLKDGYLTPGLLDLYMRNNVFEIVPPVPTSEGRTYTLPDVPGVSWEVDGVTTPAGTHSVPSSPDETIVSILPVALEGYVFEPPAEETVFVFAGGVAPDTGEAEALALMVSLLGTDAISEGEMISAFNMVRLFIMEYTRGKGFDDAGKPTPGLIAVIVAAAARLVTNPEQAVLYVLDGVTIRPAVFQGYTLAEQRVLNNYRKRFA